MGLNIIFSLVFVLWFNRIGWMPLGGLALAISLSTAIETTTLFLLLRKRLNGIQALELVNGTGAAALGTIAMSVAIMIWLQVMRNYPAALITLGGTAIGAALYGLVLLLLRVPELQILLKAIQRRLAK
jgi:putative peptidoglycan lipid II flippase